jgi:hypothetical protein
MAGLGFFLQSLQAFNAGYTGLFEPGNSRQNPPAPDTGSDFHARYGWLMVLDTLSNGDGISWSFYLDMNVVEFLNRIAFTKAKKIFENLGI